MFAAPEKSGKVVGSFGVSQLFYVVAERDGYLHIAPDWVLLGYDVDEPQDYWVNASKFNKLSENLTSLREMRFTADILQACLQLLRKCQLKSISSLRTQPQLVFDTPQLCHDLSSSPLAGKARSIACSTRDFFVVCEALAPKQGFVCVEAGANRVYDILVDSSKPPAIQVSYFQVLTLECDSDRFF